MNINLRAFYLVASKCLRTKEQSHEQNSTVVYNASLGR